MWLVKWLLAIPHYIVLFFLWIAFVVASVVAFFAILFTGRYPRGLFEFNVGVLRWSWRVSYYTRGALGTDRYPPLTPADVRHYPAHLRVEYPDRLSRGLVLVKWWLLAIPHYLLVGVFVGGGSWVAWQSTNHNLGVAPGGLIGLLELVAAIVLAFTGHYPGGIFDFVLGMNRWALRVAAYPGLMTDKYPPFKLDMAGPEPAGTMPVPLPPTGPVSPTVARAETPPAPQPAPGSEPTQPASPQTAPASPPTTPPSSQAAPPPASPAEPPPAPPTGRRGWTAGRVVSLVIGSVLGLIALAVLAGAGAATWATNSQRDSAGFLTSDTHRFATPSYAITSGGIDLGTGTDWVTPADIFGTVRIRATATDPTAGVFIGVGSQAAVDRYLAGVGHEVVTNWANGDTRYEPGRAGRPQTAPGDAAIWTVQASGPGTQTLSWRPVSGQWEVVVMNPDGAAGMSVTADAGATVPDLAWLAVILFAIGGVLLLAAVALVVVPVVRASR